MGMQFHRSHASLWFLPALLGAAFVAPAAHASAQFQAVDVSQDTFVLVAAPIGTSGTKAQLHIYEQVNAKKRPCFQVSGSNPGKVAPLLGSFDFTGICSRYVDSLGYSPRVGSEDLGTSYRLSVRKTGTDNLLVAAPAGRSAAGKPELLVARTYGSGGAVEYLEFKLEPGWRLMRRAYGGKRLGHIYIYRDSWPAGSASIPAAQPAPAALKPAPAAAPAPVVTPRPAAPQPVATIKPAAPKTPAAKPATSSPALAVAKATGSKTPMASAALALYAPSVKIACTPVSGIPTTTGQGLGKSVPLLTWYPSSFDRAGWSPQRRCDTVSQKLDRIRQKGQLKFLTTGTVARQSVICAVNTATSRCTSTNMIVTVEKGENPNDTLLSMARLQPNAKGVSRARDGRLLVNVTEVMEERLQAAS